MFCKSDHRIKPLENMKNNVTPKHFGGPNREKKKSSTYPVYYVQTFDIKCIFIIFYLFEQMNTRKIYTKYVICMHLSLICIR